jgi:hypothetical protein
VVLLAHAVRAKVATRRRAAARVRRLWRRAIATVYGRVEERLTSGATGRKGVACRSRLWGGSGIQLVEIGRRISCQDPGPDRAEPGIPGWEGENADHGSGMEFVTEFIEWFQGDGLSIKLKMGVSNGNLGLEGSWRFLVVGTRHLEMVGHFDATVMPHPRTRFNIRNARQLDAKHRLYPA